MHSLLCRLTPSRSEERGEQLQVDEEAQGETTARLCVPTVVLLPNCRLLAMIAPRPSTSTETLAA